MTIRTPQPDSISDMIARQGEAAVTASRDNVLREADWPTAQKVRRHRVRKRQYVLLFLLFTFVTSFMHVRIHSVTDSPLTRFQRWKAGWPFQSENRLPIDDQERAEALGISGQDLMIAEAVLSKYMNQIEERPLGPLDWGISIPFGGYVLQFHYRIFFNMAISAILAWAFYMRARDRAASQVIDGQNKQLRDLNRELRNKVVQVQKYAQELESAQSKLIQAQKLASIGRLSATLAHEIRNPMSIIMSAAGIAADDLPQGSPPAQAVNLIRQEITRLDQIITELLNFARPKPPRLDSHDLNTLLEGWIHPLGEELSKHNIELKLHLDPKVRTVVADADQLYQVFLNVVWNARDAAKENGGGVVQVQSLDKGKSGVELSVKDDGPGIDPDTLAQIFEPFFTTKTSGSGLGLPVVQQLMEGMGGSVQIESAPERGTTVHLRLQAAEDRVAEIGALHGGNIG